MSHCSWTDLSVYTVGDYTPGRGKFVQLLWHFVSLACFESGLLPTKRMKPTILRWFGAKIGTGVVFKTQVRIKFPWRLEIGDHTWIGQDTWIDNIAPVKIGSHACISQGVYFCTGNHDHRSATFDLIPATIAVEDGAWVAARALLLPGVTVGANALVAAGSVVTESVQPATVVGGNPAKSIAQRQQPLAKTEEPAS